MKLIFPECESTIHMKRVQNLFVSTTLGAIEVSSRDMLEVIWIASKHCKALLLLTVSLARTKSSKLTCLLDNSLGLC